jgi:peptidylprolyl isomerase
MRKLHASLPVLGLLLLTAAGDPGPSDIVAQRGDVKITASQLKDLLATVDPALRARLQSNPAALGEFVRERVVNETLLDEARAKGWDQRPEVRQRMEEARNQVLLQSYIASLVPSDPSFPTDAEVAAAYEANKSRLTLPRQYHLAQIVVLVPADASRDAEEAGRRKAADLKTQATKPKADFAEVARRNSQEATTAPRGGDVGWVREDQLLPGVREAVGKLSDGGVSDPVRAPDGWHVIRLIETRAPGPMTLAEATPQLVQALRQARIQQLVRTYVAGLLKKDPVQVNEIELAKAIAAK